MKRLNLPSSDNMMYSNILRGIWCIFILLYIICPIHMTFDMTLYNIEFSLYLIGLFCFFCIKKKKNYFDFDSVLLLFCTIEHFFGGFFIGSNEFNRLFYQGIDSTIIFKGTLLAAIGLTSYMIGASTIKRDSNIVKVKGQKYFAYQSLSPNLLALLLIVSFAVFVVFDGLEFFRFQYKEGVGSFDSNARIFQAITLITVFSNILCARMVFDYFHQERVNGKNRILIVFVFIIAVQFALVGNRTVFSYLVLPYIISYFSFVKNLNLLKSFGIMTIGVISMYIVQIYRQGNGVYSTNIFYVLSDMIIPLRSYLGTIDYVDHYGVNYGTTMMPSFYSLIPGLSTVIGNAATTGSAETITRYLTEGNITSGLGTTIISDIYLSFGAIGVIVFMFVLGKFVHRRWKNPMNDMLIQMGLFSCCVFMGRAAFFSPLRVIIWSMLFSSLIISVSNNGTKKRNRILSR